MKTEELLHIAKTILDVNPHSSLGGSLMLYVRGIDLGREPHDIDILIVDHACNIIIPKSLGLVEDSISSDGCHSSYKIGDVKVDILSCGESFEEVNGWRLCSIKRLMDVKFEYYLKGGSCKDKHYNDLINLGFKFPY